MAASITNTSNNVTLNGTEGNDTISNSGYDVEIYGNGGSDTITSSGAGDNYVQESFGSSLINGSAETGTAGGTYYDLGGGSSTIYAGAGPDTIETDSQQEVGMANDVVLSYGGAGNDTFELGAAYPMGNGGTDIAYGGAGADYFYFTEKGTGNDGYLGVATIYGGAGNDVVDLTGSDGGSFVSGDNGADSIHTSAAGDDVVYGGAGNDTILGAAGGGLALYGNAGADVITVSDNAGDGADTLFGGSGNDLITATAGTNTHYISGDIGDDTILGGAGGDSLYGGQGADSIIGGTSSTVYGGQGDDHITVSDPSINAHAHFVSGDAGDDTIDASGSHSHDTISGGLGADSISLGSATDTILVGVGESTGTESSTTTSGSTTTIVNGEANLDHILGFGTGDSLILKGEASGTASNIDVVEPTQTTPITTEAEAYEAAYSYAHGSTSGNANFAPGDAYLEVQVVVGSGMTATSETYLFAHDGTTVAFDSATATPVTVTAAEIIGS